MVDLWTAGIPEPQPPRHLVVRFAGRVVDRFTEYHVLAGSALEHDQTVATGHEQGHEWPLQIRALQKRCEEMALEMVYPDERDAPGECVGLRGRQSDQQGSDQSRATRHRDPEDLWIERVQTGLGEGPANDGADGGDVGATGQFRHDPAKGPVLVNRRLDHRGMHVELLVDDGRRRFVTTGLDSEDKSHQSSVDGGSSESDWRSAQRMRASSLVFS